MTSFASGRKRKLPVTPWGYLPPQIRCLFITGSQRTGGWLTGALASDSASEVILEEQVGTAAGVARLREELFDAILLSHELPELDAIELLEAIGAGGRDDQSVVVLGVEAEQEMAAICYEAGADAYLCVDTATIRALIWTLGRAVERRRLLAENRRLRQAERRRRELEQREADRLLSQQRKIMADTSHGRDLQAPRGDPLDGDAEPAGVLPAQLADHYRELLRTYVIMGSGNLALEMRQLSDLLVRAGVTAREAMQLHVRVLEEMVQGLGNRSTRHVMNRADMLVLEMMISLAEGYRCRFVDQTRPPAATPPPGTR